MNNLESYPPALRHLSHLPPRDPDLQDVSANPIGDPDPVPVIDLQRLSHDNKLDEACKDWGIFRLVNHGIPSTLLAQLQDLAKQLFSMPFESKQASCTSPISYFWGTPALTQTGTALTTGAQNINWVEGFNVPLGQLSQFQPQLPMLESFKLLLVDYGNHLSRIATTLYQAMVNNLDLNQEPSKSYLSEDTGILRVYRYPHCSSAANVGLGMEVHTDSSILSILTQDDQVSGLEILKDQQWLTVKPISNTFVVNLGDMMQAISNDKYKSVSHRVKMNTHRERLSLCYFVFPGDDAVIESSKYKPFTYNDFRAQVQEDIKAIGHKVGLERFKRNED